MTHSAATDALRALYQEVDQLQDAVHQKNPEMICHAGCSFCCEHHGSPLTHALEWQLIAPLLDADPDFQARVKARFLQLKQGLRDQLQSSEPVSLQEALFETACPFLEDRRCSIYPVRPLTCRTFGNTRLYADSDAHNWQEFYTSMVRTFLRAI